MKISVNKYTLEPDTVDGGTAGSHGLESLEFDFSPEWNALSRTVTFFPPKSVAKCVSFTGSTLPIPPEVTARAGKVAFVLCGARDGAAVITLTGVIAVSPTLTPTMADTEEHTPGALETATLLCAEARADAQAAAAAAESALAAEKSVGHMAEEVETSRGVISHLYDEVMDGTAVHADLTDNNRYDRTHALSVAGLLGHLEDLLSVISPFKIRVVDTLPANPDTAAMYVHDGTVKVYANLQTHTVLHRWKPTYVSADGPTELYTLQSEIPEGAQLFWSSASPPASIDDLIEYATVTGVGADGAFTTSYGSVVTVEYDTRVTIPGDEVQAWTEVSRETDMTPYLSDTPALWLITGGDA